MFSSSNIFAVCIAAAAAAVSSGVSAEQEVAQTSAHIHPGYIHNNHVHNTRIHGVIPVPGVVGVGVAPGVYGTGLYGTGLYAPGVGANVGVGVPGVAGVGANVGVGVPAVGAGGPSVGYNSAPANAVSNANVNVGAPANANAYAGNAVSNANAGAPANANANANVGAGRGGRPDERWRDCDGHCDCERERWSAQRPEQCNWWRGRYVSEGVPSASLGVRSGPGSSYRRIGMASSVWVGVLYAMTCMHPASGICSPVDPQA